MSRDPAQPTYPATVCAMDGCTTLIVYRYCRRCAEKAKASERVVGNDGRRDRRANTAGRARAV